MTCIHHYTIQNSFIALNISFSWSLHPSLPANFWQTLVLLLSPQFCLFQSVIECTGSWACFLITFSCLAFLLAPLYDQRRCLGKCLINRNQVKVLFSKYLLWVPNYLDKLSSQVSVSSSVKWETKHYLPHRVTMKSQWFLSVKHLIQCPTSDKCSMNIAISL